MNETSTNNTGDKKIEGIKNYSVQSKAELFKKCAKLCRGIPKEPYENLIKDIRIN